MPDFSAYGHYKEKIFRSLEVSFVPGARLLDVGCGDGSDARIFIEQYGLKIDGIDVYRDEKIFSHPEFLFQEGSIYHIPSVDHTYDYVFLHDVLHHIDESTQRREKHVAALQELKRVIKPDGTIILIEANRFNPLFYPHMVRQLGHDHWRQSYFRDIVTSVFPGARFSTFEAHHYPWGLAFWKGYEWAMETFLPKEFLAYNMAVIVG